MAFLESKMGADRKRCTFLCKKRHAKILQCSHEVQRRLAIIKQLPLKNNVIEDLAFELEKIGLLQSAEVLQLHQGIVITIAEGSVDI